MSRITRVQYMYRDANNYKAILTKDLAGAITEEQRAQVKAALEAGETFIPEQVGWEHAGFSQETWTSFPDEDDDHAYHELDPMNDDIWVVGGVSKADLPTETVEDWVANMVAAGKAGWDSVKYDPNNE